VAGEQAMDDYQDKLKREREWYTQPTFQAKHFLNSKLFYSQERNVFNYVFPKKRLSRLIDQIMKTKRLKKPSILIAPIGDGSDIKYIRHLSGSISAIDISQEAIDTIADDTIDKYVGDMKNMTMFPDNSFDIVLVPLFFHHFVKYGFDAFLEETHRVLKPGGCFFAIEPSSLHPVYWITRCARQIIGNITGLVEDEMPFSPLKLANAMKRCEFHDVQMFGASFSHNRVPIWIAKVNNVVTLPLLNFPFVKYFAWMCLFYGRK
jgi:SAM-dependent methyltransferase